jgi:1,4-dihydroxy-2-naphthoyl-CoA hydrolase
VSKPLVFQHGGGSGEADAMISEPVDPNDLISPLDRYLGLHISHADGRRVDASIQIGDRHWQAHGIVHGGVYCTVIETVASIGASLQAGLGRQVVGISNRTTFIRAISAGRISISGELVDAADDLQLWKVDITDDTSHLVATGQVQLMRLRDRERAVSPAP